MIAANIMTTGAMTLKKSDSVGEAIHVVSEKRVRQVPVIDDDKKVIGVLTPRSLLKAILPRYIADGLLEDVTFAPELPDFIENIDQLKTKQIEEVLEKEFVSVGPETPGMEIAALFINPKKTVESILVLDNNKRLLGVISPWDVFKRLWEYSEKNNKPR